VVHPIVRLAGMLVSVPPPAEADRLVPVRAAACTIRDLVPEDLRAECLTLPLPISSWLRVHALDPDEACQALMALREALIESSGIEARSEPVPLVVGDRRHAVLNLARYLDQLVERAGGVAGKDRGGVIDSALAELAS
jgi:hypothetical protein